MTAKTPIEAKTPRKVTTRILRTRKATTRKATTRILMTRILTTRKVRTRILTTMKVWTKCQPLLTGGSGWSLRMLRMLGPAMWRNI